MKKNVKSRRCPIFGLYNTSYMVIYYNLNCTEFCICMTRHFVAVYFLPICKTMHRFIKQKYVNSFIVGLKVVLTLRWIFKQKKKGNCIFINIIFQIIFDPTNIFSPFFQIFEDDTMKFVICFPHTFDFYLNFKRA